MVATKRGAAGIRLLRYEGWRDSYAEAPSATGDDFFRRATSGVVVLIRNTVSVGRVKVVTRCQKCKSIEDRHLER
jgi:hypothetical protein